MSVNHLLAMCTVSLCLTAARADDDDDALKALLPEGHKAYALKVPVTDQVTGFIKPGDKVKVVFTEKVKKDKAKSSELLDEVLVVAVDMAKVADDKKTTVEILTVTLAVKEADAKKLAEAEKKGSLRLVLRRPDEPKKEPNP
jgi:pilus assembly protein CpaB